ncbi:MAG: hypothetical protein D6820_07420, partial [Lentisphaerae bacterium]
RLFALQVPISASTQLSISRRNAKWNKDGIWGILVEPQQGKDQIKCLDPREALARRGKWYGFTGTGKLEFDGGTLEWEKVIVKKEHQWPEGVRRYSYRRGFDCPWNYGNDNVLLAFNVIPAGQDGWMSHLPGRIPRFSGYKTTDYEYAFNHVHPRFGGGVEVWRLQVPGMRRIHFFPRQPRHPWWGPVRHAQYAVRYENGYRLVECALPWEEIPHVDLMRRTGKSIKFAFRINDNAGPTLETGRNRSVCEGVMGGFHPGWRSGYPNELRWSWEPAHH